MCYAYHGAGEPLEKEGNAISNKDDTDEQRNAPTEHIVTELQIPAAIVDRYEAHERKKSHLEHAKLVIEALALVAVIFYAGVTYFQLSEMRQTTWLAFQDRLDKIGARMNELDKLVRDAPEVLDPSERPIADSGKAGTQPKAPTKNNQSAPGKKMEQPVAIGAQPPPAKQPRPVPDEAAGEQARENIKINRQVAKYTGRLAMLTFWLVVVTLILGIAAGIQAWIARDAEKRQLRAYVGVERGKITNVADRQGTPATDAARITNPASGPVATLEIVNWGQTPAYDVNMWAKIGVTEFPLSSTVPVGANEAKTILGPRQKTYTDATLPQRLTPQQVDDLRAGTAAIYVYGQVIYRDAFRKAHTTNFRLFHNSLTGPIGVSTELTLGGPGNSAD